MTKKKPDEGERLVGDPAGQEASYEQVAVWCKAALRGVAAFEVISSSRFRSGMRAMIRRSKSRSAMRLYHCITMGRSWAEYTGLFHFALCTRMKKEIASAYRMMRESHGDLCDAIGAHVMKRVVGHYYPVHPNKRAIGPRREGAEFDSAPRRKRQRFRAARKKADTRYSGLASDWNLERIIVEYFDECGRGVPREARLASLYICGKANICILDYMFDPFRAEEMLWRSCR